MPSCDGSGACSSNCSACKTEYVTKHIHLDAKERKQFEKRIKELQEELENEHKLNRQLVERLLEDKKI